MLTCRCFEPVHPMLLSLQQCLFFFSSRRRHTRSKRDWSSDVCSSDLIDQAVVVDGRFRPGGHDHLGVVGDIREDGLDNPPPPTLFVPTAQLDNEFTQLMNKVVATSFVVRTKPAPTSVAAEVQREVSAAGGDVAAFDFRPMESVLAGSIVRQRFNMLLLGTFAGMALTLSAVGL